MKLGILLLLLGGDIGVSYLKGINVKYCYELMDSVGVMVFLGFVVLKKSSIVMIGEDMFYYESLCGCYVSVMVGLVL